MADLADAGLYTIRVHKALATSPLNPWSNSYEFKADEAVALADLSNAALSCANFEIALSTAPVSFDRVTVSTWVDDHHPYDPATFMVVPIGAPGAGGGSVDHLALNQTLRVVRTPATGRAGHLFYRGVLNETQVTAPAGITVLVDLPTIDDFVQAALASSELENYIGATPAGPLHMVLINADGTQVRNVISLQAQGVTTLPTKHKWFNRAPTPPETP